ADVVEGPVEEQQRTAAANENRQHETADDAADPNPRRATFSRRLRLRSGGLRPTDFAGTRRQRARCERRRADVVEDVIVFDDLRRMRNGNRRSARLALDLPPGESFRDG